MWLRFEDDTNNFTEEIDGEVEKVDLSKGVIVWLFIGMDIGQIILIVMLL